MKILYLHQYFVPPDGAGGTRSYEFARRLVARGHEVHMVTSSCFFSPNQESWVGDQVIEGIRLTVIPVGYSNRMSFRRRVWAFVSFAMRASIVAVRESADVVFATSTPLTIVIPGLFAHVFRRVPMVFEVRDLWPDLPIAMGALRNPVMKWAARMLERLAYRSAGHVVALSPGMAEKIAQRGVPPERLSIIPNSCDLDLFDVSRDVGAGVRERLDLAPDQPLVTYAGTFGHINGVEYLVELASAMLEAGSNVQVLLVGKGAAEEDLLRRARELGVFGKNLAIWPPVPKREMPLLLAASALCFSVFVPVREMEDNSANKFFDSLAAGRPVAINYGGWQAELLERTRSGIVLPPHDIKEAARRLDEFLRDQERLDSAGVAARQLACAEFDRDLLADRLETVLVAACGRHRVADEVGSGGRKVDQG